VGTKQGCRWNSQTPFEAASNGSMEMSLWLQGKDPSGRFFQIAAEGAAAMGRLEVLK